MSERDQLARAQGHITVLESELARLKSSDLAAAEAEIARLKAELDEYSSIIVEANTIENNLLAEIARLKQALNEAQQEPRK